MSPNRYKQEYEGNLKALRAEFSNYENAVVLICSLEAWLEHKWGPDGENPGRLVKFDRFPEVDDWTPDFMVHFNTGYVLWGEHQTTFRLGEGQEEDIRQIMGYALWKGASDSQARGGNHDVIVLVKTHSDDRAAQAIDEARKQAIANGNAPAPVILLGCYPDRGANGEWYDLKWRSHHNNCRFSSPNATDVAGAPDLNSAIVDVPHCPIRIDKSVILGSERNPLINDCPPPLYTVVRIILPVVNQLLSDDERDELRYTGKTQKTVTRRDIVSADMFEGTQVRERYIQNGLDLLEKLDLAKCDQNCEPPRYAVVIDIRKIKDLLAWISEKGARTFVADLKRRRKTSPRAQSPAEGQGRLFEL